MRLRAYNGWAAASHGCQSRYKAGSKELKACIDNIPTNAVSPVSVQVCKAPQGCYVSPTGELVPIGEGEMRTMGIPDLGNVQIGNTSVPMLWIGVGVAALLILLMLK